MNKDRFEGWSKLQKSKWLLVESFANKEIPKTHENCIKIVGVARPGKTNRDKRKK
jgi:hypothetical protein